MQSDPAHGRDDELVEKMARAMATAWLHGEGFNGMAIAVLALARPAIREECARVAEGVTSYDDVVQKSAGCHTTGQRIAAAIRAME